MSAYVVLCAILLTGVLAGTACAQNTSSTSTEAHWRTLLGRVHVGMSRARVERIIGHTDTGEIDEHTALYALDAHWCAATPFDWHGFDADEHRNPYGLLHLYEHRVVARPSLLARDATLNARLHQWRSHSLTKCNMGNEEQVSVILNGV